MNLVLLSLVYIGMIFTDLPLSSIIGTIGSSLMFIIASTLFIFILYKKKWKYKATYISNLFLYYFLISLFISLVLFIYYAIINQTLYTPYGQLILIKLLNASIYNLVYFFAYVVLIECFKRIKIENINKSIIFIFIFLVCIGIIELINKDLLNFLHVTTVDYFRLRLTSAEPSRGFYLFEVVALLSLLVTNNKAIKAIIFIVMMIFMLLIASKGGIVFLLISILIVYLISTSLKQKIILSVLLIPIIAIFSYVIMVIVLPDLLIDIDKFTSTSTRLITTVWAFVSLIYFPFGEGYGTYMCYFKELLLLSTEIVISVFPVPLSLVEIDSMILTGVNVGVKSGILFQIVQNGFIAVMFFYLLFKKIWKTVKYLNISSFNKNILQVILVFTILTLLFGANMEILYIYILPIAYIETLKLKARGV